MVELLRTPATDACVYPASGWKLVWLSSPDDICACSPDWFIGLGGPEPQQAL